mgnify:CR=1 FL=1
MKHENDNYIVTLQVEMEKKIIIQPQKVHKANTLKNGALWLYAQEGTLSSETKNITHCRNSDGTNSL